MGVAYGSSTIYQATKGIVQDGLVLNLDAAASTISGATVYDLTGTDNATLVNAPVFNKGNGGHFILDGTDDYIQTATEKADFTTGNEITISIWFKVLAGTGGRGILQFGLSLTENTPWILFQDAGSGARWYVNTNYMMTQSRNVGQIYNLTLTYSSNLWSCYKDGSFDTSYSGGIGSDGGENFFIGTGYSGRVNMSFYTCQIYNRALTATEVAQNFNVTRHRFGI